jgi:hypothetical protein
MLSKYEPRRQQLPIQIVEQANIRDSRYSVTSLVPYKHLAGGGGGKGQTMALTRKFLVRYRTSKYNKAILLDRRFIYIDAYQVFSFG